MSHKELVDMIVNKAHLAMNDGAMFGKEGEQHMRMNVGTRREVLQQAMQQLRDAISG
jgi:cystathionine beta-lyase